jgi:ParB family chromosome partitioning protein
MSSKKRGLGRGLDALLGAGTVSQHEGDKPADGDQLRTLDVGDLEAGRHQPREYFDEAALDSLAESIRAQGVVQPLVVRPLADGRYEIVAGERRWRAAQQAGLKQVPVVVREIDDRTAMAVALVENIQRADLNPLEEAQALKRLIDECGITHEQAARAVGRSRASISNLLRLFDLSEDLQARVRGGELSFGHARALLAAPEARRALLARKVIEQQLSVRQTEALAARDAPARGGTRPDAANPYIGLADDLAEQVGLPVSISASVRGRGRVTIAFRDREELEQLMRRLGR